MLLDIHTHHTPKNALQAIHSCTWQDMPLPEGEGYYSVGIHPWYLTAENLPDQLSVLNQVVADRRVVAIGEAGLDRVCKTPFDLQLQAFRHMIQLADASRKPLIIHAVRASYELIALKKAYKPRMPWIIHGFRGKKELAEVYLQQGIFLSFGEHYQEEALRIVPDAYLFAETDEGIIDIQDWYTRAAQIRNVSTALLTQTIQGNIRRLFFRH